MLVENPPALLENAEISEIMELINSDEYRRLKSYYQQETFMDTVGVARLENPHSDFLAWLFDSSKQHGLHSFALERLLETVAVSIKQLSRQGDNNGPNLLRTDLMLDILYLRYGIENIRVKREWTGWEDSSRLDIWITFDLKIYGAAGNEQKACKAAVAIENKIGSTENQYTNGEADRKKQTIMQTEKYWDLLNAMHVLNPNEAPEYILPIFLNANSQTGAESPEFFTMNYQTLLDGVLTPCLSAVTDAHASMLLDDYIRCLGRATIFEATNTKGKDTEKNYLLLAVSKAESDMVRALWKNHRSALARILKDATEYESDKTNSLKAHPYYVHYSNNLAFYQSLFFTLDYVYGTMVEREGSGVEASIKTLLSDFKRRANQTANKKPYFIFDETRFESGKRKPYSLGWLAHELLRTWCEKNPQTEVENLIGELRRSFNPGDNKNLWIRNVCITRAEYEREQKLGHTADKHSVWYEDDYFITDNYTVKTEASENAITCTGMIPGETTDIFVVRWWGENDILKLLRIEPFNSLFTEKDRVITCRR